MKIRQLMVALTALVAAVAVHGQGQFFFTTRDIPNGNDLRFTLYDVPMSGPNMFLEVLAGPNLSSFTALSPLLPLNRTGEDAGYPNPFGATYYAPGGSTVVAYRAYQGPSWSEAITRSEVFPVIWMLDSNGKLAPLTFPTDPMAPPPELLVGTYTINLAAPEPAPWALSLLGLAMLGLFWRRRAPCP